MNDRYGRKRMVTEADEIKAVCELHGGNLFVKLHFKALENVPDKYQLINTIVTSAKESDAKFAGAGKHLIAFRLNAEPTEDDEDYLNRQISHKYIKQYVGEMFGQDVANKIQEDDIKVVMANGELGDEETLRKWDEQQKAKKEDIDKDIVSESMPSFGRFFIEEDGDAGGEEDDEDSGGDETGSDAGGEEDDEDSGGDETGSDAGGEEDDEDKAGDEDDEDEAGDEVPPPQTFYIAYEIKGKDMPESDHTSPQDIQKLAGESPAGDLILPGSKHNIGIEFLRGGSTVDTLDLKKLGKDIKGNIDSEELDVEIGKIFTKNFPEVETLERGIRDKRTLIDELKTMRFQEDDEYFRNALKQIGNSDYSFYIQLKDNPAKPYIQKKQVCDMVNAALKQMGGRWLRRRQKNWKGGVLRKLNPFATGISEKNVIELHSTTKIGANTKADRDAVFRAVPEPEEIKNIIDGKKQEYELNPKKPFDAPGIWTAVAKRFKALRDKNSKYDDHTVRKIIEVWTKFSASHKDSSDGVTYNDFKDFYEKYKKRYEELGIKNRLDESFLSERGLMRDMFGFLYEDDEESETEKGDGSKGSGDEDQPNFEVKVFVLPLPHLSKAFSRDSY